jgi:hypothetical protein
MCPSRGSFLFVITASSSVSTQNIASRTHLSCPSPFASKAKGYPMPFHVSETFQDAEDQ